MRAIRFGCNAIGLAVAAPEQRRQLVRVAHGCGVPVEGTPVPDGGIGRGEAALQELVAYVEHTNIDLLNLTAAVCRGGAQGLEGLAPLRDALRIPIALDDDLGMDDADYAEMAGFGVAKVNYGRAVPTADTIERRMGLVGAAGWAGQALAQCRPWAEVAHLIVYNSTAIDSHATRKMITEGRRVLAQIPGVRGVFAGETVRDDAHYRYTWLVRFCSEAVIDTYRDHPDHVAFADGWFRPLAGDRISIDYTELSGRAGTTVADLPRRESA